MEDWYILKKMKLLTIVFPFLLSLSSFSQNREDTLNRFDTNNKKTGYWICYLDSNFNLNKKENAKYYGFEHFINGKLECKYFYYDKLKVRAHKKYLPNHFDTIYKIPELINGEVFYYDKFDSLLIYEKYINGKPSIIEDYAFTQNNKKIKIESLYYDSLFNNMPGSYLDYDYDFRNGLPEYKQYFKNGKSIGEPFILYKHKVIESINKPRIGFIYQSKSFLEIGYSKKHTKQTIDSAGVTRFPTKHFSGFTVSFLGNFNKTDLCIGQKAVYNYFYKFINSEIGLVNYTKSKSNDFRITLSTGLSILGRLSLMYSYSIPLTNNIFNEISRNSISIIIH